MPYNHSQFFYTTLMENSYKVEIVVLMVTTKKPLISLPIISNCRGRHFLGKGLSDSFNHTPEAEKQKLVSSVERFLEGLDSFTWSFLLSYRNNRGWDDVQHLEEGNDLSIFGFQYLSFLRDSCNDWGIRFDSFVNHIDDGDFSVIHLIFDL